MVSSEELPSNVIFEILTRTSLETLDTCKVVSKTWNKVTYESNFMQSYCQRTNNISGYFVQYEKDYKFVIEFVSMDGCSGKSSLSHLPLDDDRVLFNHYCNYKIEASSKQGILCCMRETRHKNHRYYICKPSTKEWKALPNPKLRYRTAKVALVVLKSNPLHFKIIRLSQDLRTRSRLFVLDKYFCEIFDSEICAWRQANIIHDMHFNLFGLPVNASGLVYYLTKNNQVLVLNYDGEEAYPRFSLPQVVIQNKDDYKEKRLVEYKSKLGFICLSPNETVELWCIENTKNHLWIKEKEVNIESLNEVTSNPSPVDFYSNGIVFMKGFNKLVFYKQENHKSSHEVKLDMFVYPTEIFPFRSDVEQICLKPKEKNIGCE